jgi:hypothetical protein
MRRLLFLSFFAICIARAQPVSVGLTGGLFWTDEFPTSTVTTSNSLGILLPASDNYTLGPNLQVNLPLRLRFEVDALYRPYNFSTVCPLLCQEVAAFALRGAVPSLSISASQWRFPFLLQYRFNLPFVKPFVEAGPSFEHLSHVSNDVNAIPPGQAGHLLHTSDAALVVGGGVDVKVFSHLRFSFELRYTHEGAAYFQSFTNVDQGEALFGVHF